MEWNSFAFISFICFLMSSSSAILSFAARKSGPPFLYGLMSTVLAVWSLALFFCLSTPEPDSALFWARLANCVILMLPALIFHFSVSFVEKKDEFSAVTALYYSISVAYLAVILMNQESFLTNPTYRLDQFWFPQGGTLFYFFPALFTVVVAHAIHVLCMARSQSDRDTSLKIDYMLCTIIVGVLGGGLSISLEFGIDIPPYGILSVALMVVISTYAVLKHDLLDFPETLSVIAARAMTYICVFALVILLLKLAEVLSLVTLTSFQMFVTGLIAVFAAEVYAALKGTIQSLSDRLLIKQRVDHEKSFRTLVHRLESATSFELMLPLLREYFEAQRYIYHYAWYLDKNLLEQSLKHQAQHDFEFSEQADSVFQRILFSFNDGRRKDRLPSVLRLDYSAVNKQGVKQQVVKLMSSEQLDAAFNWVEKVPGREMIGLPVIANKTLRGMLLIVVNKADINRAEQSSLQSLTSKLAQLIERIEFYRQQSSLEQSFLLEKMAGMKALAANIAYEVKQPLNQLESFVRYMQHAQLSHSDPAQSLDIKLQCKQAQSSLARSRQSIDITLEVLQDSPVDASDFQLLSIQSVVAKALADYVFLPGERELIETDLRQGFVFKGSETLSVFAIFNLLKASLTQGAGRAGFKLEISSQIGERVNALVVSCVDFGFSEALLEDMVNSHFCTSASQSYGLGLAYCQRIMTALGGALSFSSDSSGNVDFYLQFQPVLGEASPAKTDTRKQLETL